MSETAALKLLDHQNTSSDTTGARLNKAHRLFTRGQLSEDEFYKTLLNYITMVVKSRSHDDVTFTNLEDSISTSIIKIWRRLKGFRSAKSSFARFVSIVVESEIRRHLDAYRVQHPPYRRCSLEEAENLVAPGLSPEQQMLFDDWLGQMSKRDRTITQMTMDGLTTREIGQALGISHTTVARALSALKNVTKRPF